MGMEGLSRMLGSMAAAARKPLVGDALASFRSTFAPIADLKAGDRLRWKKNLADSVIPAELDVIEVFETFPPKERPIKASNHDADRYDFSAAFVDDKGDVALFYFDSRRFERVE